jgi:cellulose synthase/poly-beta-1,6-N-acetylglucosamine synthase-like glycosyltransferase
MIALSLVAALWCFVLFVFASGAWRNTLRTLARARRLAAWRPDGAWPAIVILRPLQGEDRGLAENLWSTVAAAYPGRRRVRLLVPTAADPAHAVAEAVKARAAREAPEVPVEVRVTAIETRGNRKVAQLVAGADGLDEEVVVTVDSDIRLDDDTLPALVATLMADPRAGAVSAPLVEVRARTLGDWLSASLLSSTPHALLCLAALSDRAGTAQLMCGALVVYRRAVLEAIGGFASLESFLGEDFEVARRLHEAGHSCPIAAVPARAQDEGRTLGQVLRRYARWATVTRQQRPRLLATYWLLLGGLPPALGLAALSVGLRLPAWPVAAACGALALVVHLMLLWVVRRGLGFSPNPLVAIPALVAGQLFICATAFGALGPSEVEWRGHRYHVGPGGRMHWLGTRSTPASD